MKMNIGDPAGIIHDDVVSDAMDVLANYHPDWGSRYDTVVAILSLGFQAAQAQEKTKTLYSAEGHILDQ